MSEFNLDSYLNSEDDQIRKWAIILDTAKLKKFRRNQIQQQIINRVENFSKWVCPFTKQQFPNGTQWGRYLKSKKYRILTGELTEVKCRFCSDIIIKGEELTHYQKKVKCYKLYVKYREQEFQRKIYKRWGYLENHYAEHSENADKWTEDLIREMNEYILNQEHNWGELYTIEKNEFGLYIKIRKPELVITRPPTPPQQEDDYLSPEEENNKFIMESASYKLALEAQERYEAEQKRILDWESKNKLVEI